MGEYGQVYTKGLGVGTAVKQLNAGEFSQVQHRCVRFPPKTRRMFQMADCRTAVFADLQDCRLQICRLQIADSSSQSAGFRLWIAWCILRIADTRGRLQNCMVIVHVRRHRYRSTTPLSLSFDGIVYRSNHRSTGPASFSFDAAVIVRRHRHRYRPAAPSSLSSDVLIVVVGRRCCSSTLLFDLSTVPLSFHGAVIVTVRRRRYRCCSTALLSFDVTVVNRPRACRSTQPISLCGAEFWFRRPLLSPNDFDIVQCRRCLAALPLYLDVFCYRSTAPISLHRFRLSFDGADIAFPSHSTPIVPRYRWFFVS